MTRPTATHRKLASIALFAARIAVPASLLGLAVVTVEQADRTRTGLLALYDFSEAQGVVVQDRSGVGEPLDLKITNTKSVRRSVGSLEVRGTTLIRSDKPATKIIDAIRRSGELSIEAWVRPGRVDQSGPARIVTLSKHATERCFTLGHDGDHYDVRLRTDKTSANGIPSVASTRNSLASRLTHIVYTRERSGRTRIYIDGKRNTQKSVAGRTAKWSPSMHLALANEMTGDRPWQGTYHLVAIYSRDLSSREVAQNFRAGARAPTGTARLAEKSLDKRAHFFETRVAPVIAKHCLECHDSSRKKGRLDLSRKAAALAGGKHGKVIVPGDSAASPLWEAVASDDMPDDRPPLSEPEKQILKQWIDSGATWSLARIDPAVYVHGGRAAKNWIRRLTVAEYIETVRSAVGVDVTEDVRKILPRDSRADGFSNTAYNLNVDLGHVQAYAELAAVIVGKMDVIRFAARFGKNRKLTDDNMRGLVGRMGKHLLRGPLASHEIDPYRGISTTVASAGGDFEEAVGFVIEAMLQSPRFLYRMETQREDGESWLVDEYELASRMSYILWGAPPDRELMQAADSGALADPDIVETHVERMLKDSRAMRQSARFADEWLNLGGLADLQPNPKRFPNWNSRLAADMHDETLAVFKDVTWTQKRPLSDVLNVQFTYLTPRLARHYGLVPKGEGRQRYDLTAVPSRGGLLTQGSVLTVGGDDASMVTRGLFILHDLLRGVVKDPPPCVDSTPIKTKAGRSQRRIAEGRIANRSCGGCHLKFEPLAFGLEKFDGLGAHHDVDEHGNKLRDDGEILFPGADQPVPYRTAAELMNLLAGSERVRETITWKLTQFALGRPLIAADARAIYEIHKVGQIGGGTYQSLMTAIIMSDLVQRTRTDKQR